MGLVGYAVNNYSIGRAKDNNFNGNSFIAPTYTEAQNYLAAMIDAKPYGFMGYPEDNTVGVSLDFTNLAYVDNRIPYKVDLLEYGGSCVYTRNAISLVNPDNVYIGAVNPYMTIDANAIILNNSNANIEITSSQIEMTVSGSSRKQQASQITDTVGSSSRKQQASQITDKVGNSTLSLTPAVAMLQNVWSISCSAGGAVVDNGGQSDFLVLFDTLSQILNLLGDAIVSVNNAIPSQSPSPSANATVASAMALIPDMKSGG